VLLVLQELVQHPVHLELVLQEPRVLQVLQAQVVLLVLQVQQVHQEHLEIQVQTVMQVNLV